MYKQKLTPQQAFQKAKHYCGYQERCHQEVKEKLYSFGLYKIDVEQLLSQLIEENYLNEERFAIQFAGGKFRLKKWGRIKIKYELTQKRVSAYNIKKAMKEIDEEEYEKILFQLTDKKWKELKHEQYLNRLAKTTSYLLQKGYEPQLITATLNKLRNKE
jgi:regulatory protein